MTDEDCLGVRLHIPTLKVTCTSLLLLVPKQKPMQYTLINQTKYRTYPNLTCGSINVLFNDFHLMLLSNLKNYN